MIEFNCITMFLSGKTLSINETKTSLLFSKNTQVLKNKVEMMLLEHVAVELIFWVETNQQLKWRLPVSKSKDKFGSQWL